MAVENATFIAQLDETFPGSGESKTQGDDHLRLIKRVLKTTFPNIAGVVTLSHTALNALGAGGSSFIDVLKAKFGNTAGTAVQLQGDLDMNGKQFANLGGPTQNLHAATKSYVDTAVQGVTGGPTAQAWPVGSVFLSMVNTNPATLLGYGTWAQMAFGRTLIGEGTTTDVNGEQRTFVAGSAGGEYRHTQTVDELAKHGHSFILQGSQFGSSGEDGGFVTNEGGADRYDANIGSSTGTAGKQIGGTGLSSPMNNIQPYLVVFMWKRTA